MNPLLSSIRRLRRDWNKIVPLLPDDAIDLLGSYDRFEQRCLRSLGLDKLKPRVPYGAFLREVLLFGRTRKEFTVQELLECSPNLKHLAKRSCAANLYRIAADKPELLIRVPGVRGVRGSPAKYKLTATASRQ